MSTALRNYSELWEFFTIACQEMFVLHHVLQGSQDDTPVSLEECCLFSLHKSFTWVEIKLFNFQTCQEVPRLLYVFDFFLFINQLVGLKQSWISNFSFLSWKEVFCLLHVLQGSYDDVPDSLEECLTFTPSQIHWLG